jgi:hypothetical protein
LLPIDVSAIAGSGCISFEWHEKGEMTMLRSLMLALVVLFSTTTARAESVDVRMYKSPYCSCCEEYAKYLREHGFNVTVTPTDDLAQISRQNGVPEDFAGCHTMLIGGYVVEGHVPVGAINKLLSEKPKIKGISLPGMPEGSPGMSGVKTGSFEILEIADGPGRVFARE